MYVRVQTREEAEAKIAPAGVATAASARGEARNKKR